MLEANNATRALLQNRALRCATLWKITRTDTTVLAFTDHDGEITFEGTTYSPADSFQATATSSQDSMRGQEVQALGIISDSAISHDDLKAGKYKGATITESLVDWRYPWSGAYRTTVFIVQDVKFDGDKWQADISGLTSKLQPSKGQVYSRICRHSFGDANCTYTLSTVRVTGASVTASADRLHFTASHASFSGQAAGLYNFGLAKFTSHGDFEMEIKESSAAIGNEIDFTLVLPTTFDHSVSDTVTVTQGCDLVMTTCHTRFDNLENFGGFAHMPGTDRILQTPDK
jgi:uncharacterized phage protein (TIGR02218 family)